MTTPTTTRHTILGAGGAIATELTKVLLEQGESIRLVGRNPRPVPGVDDVVTADITDLEQTVKAVAGSAIVYLLVGLKYDHHLWREAWPRIMRHTIEACKQAGARLLFFDNVYMYGKVDGPMTEETPFNPCSKKGEIRADIATTLLREMKTGDLTALIARSADFYGPSARTSVANILIFEKFAQGARAVCLVDDSTPHSYTFTPDAGRSLAVLAGSEQSWGQTWHLPTTATPPTGREWIEWIAREFAVPAKYLTLHKPMLKLAGFFDANIRESYEMLYQNTHPYIFDSTKFAQAFGQAGTPYEEGIRQTAGAYR